MLYVAKTILAIHAIQKNNYSTWLKQLRLGRKDNRMIGCYQCYQCYQKNNTLYVAKTILGRITSPYSA